MANKDLKEDLTPDLFQTLLDCLSLCQGLSERLSSRLDENEKVQLLRIQLRLAYLGSHHTQEASQLAHLSQLRARVQRRLQEFGRNPAQV